MRICRNLSASGGTGKTGSHGTRDLAKNDSRYSPAFWFVLGLLYKAEKEGILPAGEMILETARQQNVALSQKKIRDILALMTQKGFDHREPGKRRQPHHRNWSKNVGK